MTNTNTNDLRQISAVAAPTVLLTALTVVIATICAIVANRLWHQDITVTHENRIIENTQVFFLLIATALHALHAGRQPVSAQTARICHMTLGMLCLSIMVREIDIDKLGSQPGWELAENLIRLTGGAVWIWLLTHAYRYRMPLWRRKADTLLTATSVLTGLGVLLYMASWFFDKSVVPMPTDRSQLWEETLQMGGTICLFTASLRGFRLQTH